MRRPGSANGNAAPEARGQWDQQLNKATIGTPPLGAIPDRGQSMFELPPANVTRWTIRRKAAVVIAVAAGTITREEACRRYLLTEEELLAWQRAFEAHGLPGLRSTRLQQYRTRRS